MSLVPHITKANQYITISASHGYAVVYLYTDSCPACVTMTPVFERTAMAHGMSQNIKFYKLNGGADWRGLDQIFVKFRDRGFPRVIIFKDNKISASCLGRKPRKEFEEWLLFHTASNKSAVVKACTLKPVEAGKELMDSSPLIKINDLEGVSPYINSPNPIFIVLGVSEAPYYQALSILLQQTALLKADEVVMILVTFDDADDPDMQDYIETYFLKYRAYAMMILNMELFGNCQFDAGELDEHFTSWLDNCLIATSVANSADSGKAENSFDYDQPQSTIEITSKRDLYEEITNGGTLIVLFHDDMPLSKAMAMVHEAASHHPHQQNTKFFRVDFDLYDAFVEPLSLEQGPTTFVFHDGREVASRKGAMLATEFEAWTTQALSRAKMTKLPFVSAYVTDIDRKSLLSVHALSDKASLPSRSTSRASDASHWDAASDAERLRGRLKCEGGHEDRAQRRGLAKLLKRSKPFFDKERGCVIVPSDSHEGLQLGRASEGGSYFNLTLRLSPDDPMKIEFRMEFGTDPTVDLKSRFESATLTIDFGYDDEDGKPHLLKLREVHPKDLKGEASVIHFGKESEASLGVGVGYTAASVTAEGKMSKNASFSRKTVPRVKGSGDLTHSAYWTFEEDGGEAGQHGLDPHYELSVVLSHAPIPLGEIWMTFWGKAVLRLPRSKEKLKLGSQEEPFRRTLPLDLDSFDV
ncbi:hypothetical protein BDQ12DRAFT_740084 [Crucibulum laeve]|uniref:Thioredoxin domain-containing protein n=1 Tax=Crucibulum laeve TaxID=68775 RepID=A0A5C3LGQ0_9AGAR|nr:hypothetical protein BDQ12DRAFT_740084 [Crucibulum laeve]